MALSLANNIRWSRFHFQVRLGGVTGLLIAGAGLLLLLVGLRGWGVGLLLVGGLLAVGALGFEIKSAVGQIARRRGAAGVQVLAQVLLATLLLVGINVFSFWHYLRFDWTRERLFTIPANIRADLSNLRGETTIVLFLRHASAGQLGDKPDAYDAAAERKVVEKVRDLVEQFQELGPRFQVHILDVQEEGYTDKLDSLTANAKELRGAIDQAADNSIFFYADGKVQRLSFHDIYQLDKIASRGASDGRGNLVLRYQGMEPFARMVLNIDEKRPRVAIGVVHEILGTEGSDELGMAGAKKVLTAHGIDSRDLILKKWSEMGPPEPAVLTYDENKLDRLEEEIKEVQANVKVMTEEVEAFAKIIQQWKTAPLDELSKSDVAKQLQLPQVTEALREPVIRKALEPSLAFHRAMKEDSEKELKELMAQREGVSKAEESLAEQRRISDVKAKTERMLADCDLLILPRMTLFNVTRSERIPNWVYRIDQAQVDAVQSFLKAGKPVLVLFGPENEPPGRMDPMEQGPDRLEDLLAQLGIRLARQTVLFNVESKSFAERRGGLLIPGASVEVPPVKFDWEPGAGKTSAEVVLGKNAKPNPLQESLRLRTRSLGKDQALDLRLRHPRPVYFEPTGKTALGNEATFMMTDEKSWNEDQPYPTRERTPRYEPPKGDDSAQPPWEKKRLGPFPVGVAVETILPSSWYKDQKDSKDNHAVRVAAIGHGGIFMGPSLSPTRQEVLLDVCNWLLGRDDLLAKDRPVWQYPRLVLSDTSYALWRWGTFLGLPVLFIYLGFVVLLVRRLR